MRIEQAKQPKRGRSISPDPFSDDEDEGPLSPPGRFYHSPSPARAASPIRRGSPAYHDTQVSSYVEQSSDPIHATIHVQAQYQYTRLLDNEIRLLRISPGSFYSTLLCSLKIIPLDKLVTDVHEFQALSYAWGDDTPTYEVFLSDLPRSGDDDSSATKLTEYRKFLIRENLYNALQRIRLTEDHLWLWVDCLCIEQSNEEEKSQQIPKMPHIYASAWNVIAWLGDDYGGADIEAAVRLIPDILNLNTLDRHLFGEVANEEYDLFCLRLAAFSRILERPWFSRRWVIQEVACARRLSVRIADKILSWLDFADAVDLFSDVQDQLQVQQRHMGIYRRATTRLGGTKGSAAVALMRLSRNVFQRSLDSAITSRLMSLESLVLTTSSFEVSDVRDTVYSLLYLANDMHQVVDASTGSQLQNMFTPDYSKHPVNIFKDFVRYSIARSKSLDVLYRQWACRPRSHAQYEYNNKLLPSWIGVARISLFPQRHVPSESFLGPVGSQIYHASQGFDFQKQVIPAIIDDVIQLDGMLLGSVGTISLSTIRNGYIEDSCLKMLGWRGTLDEGIDDRLWRTLVANRGPNGKVAPTWYRRACASALRKLVDNSDLDSASISRSCHPRSKLVDYLKHVQEATANQKIFRCEDSHPDARRMPAQKKASEAIVGLGPAIMSSEDKILLCILYGSSVPVMLNVIPGPNSQDDKTLHVKLVGPCYAHGHMEGEIFASMSEEDLQRGTTKFSIH